MLFPPPGAASIRHTLPGDDDDKSGRERMLWRIMTSLCPKIVSILPCCASLAGI